MNVDHLDLKKLRAFRLVARYGSLRDAAMRLNVSVSAVSVSISKLEAVLGIQLFKRLPNKLILTPQGEHFARSAEAIFEGIEKILSDSRSGLFPGGKLAISISGDIAWYFIPKIRNFLTRFNDVRLGVYLNDSARTLRLVQRGEVNLGIGRFNQIPNEIKVKPLIRTSVSLVCTADHPLLDLGLPSLSDLSEETMITLTSWQSSRQIIDAAFADADVRFGSHIEAGNCKAIMDFVEAGLGIGLIHSFCRQRNTFQNLEFIDLQQHFGNLTFSATYQREPRCSPELFESLLECLSQK